MATSKEREMILAAVIGRKPNAGGWVRINCPVCPTRKGSEDRRHSFGFRTVTGGFRCFRCGVNGRADGEGFIPPEEADAQEPDDKPKVIIDDDDFFPLWTPELRHSPALDDARMFLENRGITEQHWHDANIHGAIGGKYNGRIIVPHEDHDGATWWGFTARCWVERPPEEIPKVLYPKHMDRTRLYNEQALNVATDRPVMLVEGCLDAVWYLPDVVASLGKPTETHVERIRWALIRSGRPIVICLDGDAWEEGQSLAYRLRLRGVHAGFVRLPAQEDPNSVDPNWLRNEVANALGEPPCKTSNLSPPSQP